MGGTLVVMNQDCILDLLTIAEAKSMAQGWDGEYVHTGDSIGVVMDMTKGKLSFALKKKNLGVAYEGIPLDKPLVPCVIYKCNGDSVELVI